MQFVEFLSFFTSQLFQLSLEKGDPLFKKKLWNLLIAVFFRKSWVPEFSCGQGFHQCLLVSLTLSSFIPFHLKLLVHLIWNEQ